MISMPHRILFEMDRAYRTHRRGDEEKHEWKSQPGRSRHRQKEKIKMHSQEI